MTLCTVMRWGPPRPQIHGGGLEAAQAKCRKCRRNRGPVILTDSCLNVKGITALKTNEQTWGRLPTYNVEWKKQPQKQLKSNSFICDKTTFLKSEKIIKHMILDGAYIWKGFRGMWWAGCKNVMICKLGGRSKKRGKVYDIKPTFGRNLWLVSSLY